MDIELPEHIILTKLEPFFRWAKSCSLYMFPFGTACCGMELIAVNAARYDLMRFGVIPRSTPRQADLMTVAGTITEKMAPLVKRLYEQMAESKYVIAIGSCAISGGPYYYDTYSVVKGVDKIIPVDVYIPGCPPRPEAIIQGFMELQEKIRKRECLITPVERQIPQIKP